MSDQITRIFLKHGHAQSYRSKYTLFLIYFPIFQIVSDSGRNVRLTFVVPVGVSVVYTWLVMHCGACCLLHDTLDVDVLSDIDTGPGDWTGCVLY